MVEAVGKYTAMPEPRLGQVRISALLQGALKGWKEKYGQEKINIELKLLPEDPNVFVDVELMEMALRALLKNAQEAVSPEGGAISIASWWEDKWIVISVVDDGAGIDPKNLPFVFDPFFTTKTHGSGLGLTTVNRIVSGHCGKVKVFSTPETGTEVRILLPPNH